MPNQKDDKKRDKEKKDGPLKPDPETLHTTDPQEKMEGPVSSIVQNIKETAEDDDSKEKKDKKK
jgi:hypothetical protein